MKSQKFKYIVVPALILIPAFILTFQNCNHNDNGSTDKASVSTIKSDTSSTTTTTLSRGDKAIFKLSETYGGQISNIFWQVKRDNTTIATGKENNIEIDWDDILVNEPFVIEAFMQLEENSCLTYRQLSIEANITMVDDPIYTSYIKSTPSPDESPIKQYFPIETPVDLKFTAYGAMGVAPDFNSLQWSIKKQFILSNEDDQPELADQTNKTEKLTHTFSETGLYNISVEASAPDDTTSTSTQLLIGRCEGDDLDDLEIIFNSNSIGLQTPEKISNIRPVWNYIRPSDTDPNVDITTLAIDNRWFGGHVYKYPRNSTSKFIDIDIQNADECFLDTEPIQTCSTTENGCPTEQPTCVRCIYEIREDLSPLSSCSGNALDMSTLDTDTTECTDDVFVVTASKEGQEYKTQRTFYKHCPADQDYCYFGYENFGYKSDRPDDHKCPSS